MNFQSRLLEQSNSRLAFHFEQELPSSWHAKCPVSIEAARYIIKTADTIEEFHQVISLRSSVFFEEFAKNSNQDQLDFEERDRSSDFLIIKDKDSEEVLASYRLICSRFSQDFYSLSEFQISSLLQLEGEKLELSRACVRPDKRSKGIFVHLLWRGLAAYVQKAEIRYLFGCSSLQNFDLQILLDIYRYLDSSQCLNRDWGIKPHQGFEFLDEESFFQIMNQKMTHNGESHLPPILAAYLKAGAKVYGMPAFDEDFRCLDLFTVLDFAELKDAHGRKYLGT